MRKARWVLNGHKIPDPVGSTFARVVSRESIWITFTYAALNVTGFYPSPKSFWSCTHVNSYQEYTLYSNLHILLNILCKTTLNIQESRKSIKCLKR